MLIVIVASGPDKGRVYEFSDAQPVTLGRTVGPIRFTDTKVSREHAYLWCDGGQWFIKDLNSRHGTFRNNKPIDTKTLIKDGDRIQVGRSVLVMSRVPVEQAERIALIGAANREPLASSPADDDARDAGDESEAPAIASTGVAAAAAAVAPTLVLPKRRLFLPLTAVAAAIALIAINVYFHLDAQQRTQRIQTQLEQARVRDSSADAEAELARQITDLSTSLTAAAASRTDLETQQRELLAQLKDALLQQSQRVAQIEKTALQIAQHQTDRGKADDQALAALIQTIQSRPSADELTAAIDVALKAQPEKSAALLEQVLAKLDAGHKTDEQTDKVLKQVLAAVEGQPQATRLAMQEALEKHDQALALASAENRKLLQKVWERLQAQPDPLTPASLEELTAAVREQPQRIGQAVQSAVRATVPAALQWTLNRSLSPLVERDAALAASLTELAGAMRDQPQQFEAAVQTALLRALVPLAQRQAAAERAAADRQARLLQALAGQPEQLAQIVEKAAQRLAAARPDPDDATQDVAARKDEAQAKLDGTLTALSDAIRKEAQTTRARVDQAIAQMTAQRQANPAATQVKVELDPALAAAVAAMREQPVRLERAVQKALDRLAQDRPDHAAALAELGETLKAQSAQTEKQLTALLELAKADTPSDRDAQQRKAIEQLLVEVQASPVRTQTLLAQTLAQASKLRIEEDQALIAKVAAAQAAAQAESKVDEDAAPAGPVQAELSDATLARIREAVTAALQPRTTDDKTQALLRQVLAELRSSSEPLAAAVLDGLRLELRKQLDTALASLESNRAGAPAPAPGTAHAAAAPAGRPALTPLFPGDGPLAAAAASHPAPAPASSSATPATTTAASTAELTDLQQAYKRAFETGKPVTLPGTPDPATGKMLAGRTLDPAKAIELGIAGWRDWYNIDDFQEQESLRLAAALTVSERPSPLTTPLYQWARQTLPDPTTPTFPAATETAAADLAPQRIVFIVDTGEAVGKGWPVVLARLSQQLDALRPQDQFTVLFCQRDRVLEPGQRGLKPVSSESRQTLDPWLRADTDKLTPRGRSEPTAALRRAMTLKPDQIILLGACFTGEARDQISHGRFMALLGELNPDRQVKFSAVHFFSTDPQRTLQLVAQAYHGQYDFVPDPDRAQAHR